MENGNNLHYTLKHVEVYAYDRMEQLLKQSCKIVAIITGNIYNRCNRQLGLKELKCDIMHSLALFFRTNTKALSHAENKRSSIRKRRKKHLTFF